MVGDRKNKADKWMPKYVYRGKSSYEYRPDKSTCIKLMKRPKDRIETEQVKAKIWAEYKKANVPTAYKVSDLIRDFHDSRQFKDKGKRTQEDYKNYSENIIKVFGDMEPRHIEPIHIRQFMDARVERISSESDKTGYASTNRHHSYLSVLLAWGLERNLCQSNPAKEVRKFKEEPRERYVEQHEFDLVHKVALDSSYPYIAHMMMVAYLCRMRPNEVRALCEKHILDDGVFVERGKGSENEITRWSSMLTHAIKSAREMHPNAPVTMTRPIFHDKHGVPIKAEAFKTGWQRVMKLSVEKGLKERFTFHDLKARGITNHQDKYGGHKSKKMAKVYDRKPSLRDATE